MGKVQKLREPLRLSILPVGDLYPILRSAQRREHRDGEDCLQGVQRDWMLAGEDTPDGRDRL